jgi:hypothetical protein
MSDRLHDATGQSAGLERALEELRGDVPVRPEWRAQLERALSDAAPAMAPRAARHTAETGHRRWSMRPAAAVAAAIGFMLVGAVGASQWQQRMNSGVNGDPGSARAATTLQPTRAEQGAVGVRFAVVAPGVARVSLVGDFNGWDPKATPLTLARDGRTWTIMLPLSSGRHTYAFVIDDEIVADPAAPPAIEDDFGKPSSFVLVASTLP